ALLIGCRLVWRQRVRGRRRDRWRRRAARNGEVVDDFADADRVFGERDGAVTGRVVGDHAGERHKVFVLDADVDLGIGELLIPMQPTVDAALHTEFVDGAADIGPTAAKFFAKTSEAAIDGLAHAFADAGLVISGGGWRGGRGRRWIGSARLRNGERGD